jgi:hypothetical protein
VDYHPYEPYDPILFVQQPVEPILFVQQPVEPILFVQQPVEPILFAQQSYVDPNLFTRHTGSASFEGAEWDPQARAWRAGRVRETEKSPDSDPRGNCCSTAGQYCSKHGAWHMP